MKRSVSVRKVLSPQDNGTMNSAMKITLAIEIGINFISNFVLNALCAWILNKNASAVATNAVSVFIDLCITCMFICLCTTPFASAAAKRYKKSQLFKDWTPKTKLLSKYPRKSFLLALSFAFSAMLPLGILFGIGFCVLGITELTVFSFSLYKGVLGGIIGGFVCALTLARYQF